MKKLGDRQSSEPLIVSGRSSVTENLPEYSRVMLRRIFEINQHSGTVEVHRVGLVMGRLHKDQGIWRQGVRV